MMKTLKPILLVILGVFFTLTSCRTEDDLAIDPPAEQAIEASSAVANLMSSVATNDGSIDNIVYNANCFTFELPITVTVNSIVITINEIGDYDDLEDILDAFDDDDDTIDIEFPVTIVLADYTEIVINSYDELEDYADDCFGENEDDDDIECIDFEYPITASVFNANNDLIESIVINNDNDMYDFIDDLDEFAAVTIEFPITVIYPDGTTESINTIQELEVAIEIADDSCDEDDDYDYNDDDCDNCTTDLLSDVLTQCSNWYIDELERNDNDLEDNYAGYLFTFNSDNTISVSWDNGSQTETGTWNANGTGNNISVEISIPGFTEVNDTWFLHEIESEDDDELEVSLRIGDDDELEFKNNCSGTGNVDDSNLVNALTNGDWYVTYFFDDTDETVDFSDYVFNFASDNTATATDSNGTVNGIWSTSSGDTTPLGLNLNFGTIMPLDELQDDWDVIEVTNDIIRLRDVSGGDGSEDFLTFERTPFESNGNSDLANILSDGLWFVASYVNDGDDETNDYNGYELDFNVDGTVTASNANETISGTWSVLSGGTEVMLDFGSQMLFQELNDDDWDVVSVTETEVNLEDVSGDDGTDMLTLQKL